jgi:hypothetical protein
MPLLFYGRLDKKRRLYSGPYLGRIETSIFDRWKIGHLAPHSEAVGVANYWWFKKAKHTAISWTDNRRNLQLPVGLKANEIEPYEQTIFIPGLVSSHVALEIARTEFPDWLVPSPIIFKFNNPDLAFLHD